ncbi:MAG: hypothetical protein WB773_21445, partial [Isosphaeraceae bacterium]
MVFIESAGGRDFLLGFRARAHLARDPPNVTAAGPGLETVTSIEIEDQRHARLEGSLEERRQFGR